MRNASGTSSTPRSHFSGTVILGILGIEEMIITLKWYDQRQCQGTAGSRLIVKGTFRLNISNCQLKEHLPATSKVPRSN